ncbi:IS3 family transposase [Nitrospira sp. T9]|uniref:IS3 family transposase n=1 Tax=unclassified Nitrospira TaxID=2652172 RepID=UPI003F9CF1C4
MKATFPDISERQVCRVLRVARSTLHRTAARKEAPPTLAEPLVMKLHTLIQEYPTYGYRRLWAWLRYREGLAINRKAVYRALRIKQWLVHQRTRTPRPRAQRLRSRTPQSDQRWAMDVTHIPCGQDGWGHLTAVIDCHDREIIGYEFALRGRAKEAERAIEAACLARFGTLRPGGTTPVLRSDNGLIFQSRRFRQACRAYRLQQEFITPYTPEQNGLIERFFRSLKEECVWQHHFEGFDDARQMITRWMRWYNEERPHQALRYRSPRQFRQEQHSQVA